MLSFEEVFNWNSIFQMTCVIGIDKIVKFSYLFWSASVNVLIHSISLWKQPHRGRNFILFMYFLKHRIRKKCSGQIAKVDSTWQNVNHIESWPTFRSPMFIEFCSMWCEKPIKLPHTFECGQQRKEKRISALLSNLFYSYILTPIRYM